MLLFIDNFDSFTYNLIDYLYQAGKECKIFRNNVGLEHILKENYEGVVLSPGPESPSKAGNLIEIINYYHDKIPVLGICLGHQAIGQYFGAKVEKALLPMHGKISRVWMEKDPLFENIGTSINAVRYHSLVIKDLPSCLQPIAFSADKEIMAIRHEYLPVKGIQFHPEAILTENGFRIVENWVRQLAISNEQ